MADRITVPAEVSGLRLLDRVDYEDSFSAATNAERTPEQWLRDGLDAAPPGLLGFARLAQRGLGLGLSAVDGTHPLGWSVLRSDDEVFVLGVDGTNARGRMIATTPTGRFVLTTQLQLTDRRARRLWSAIAPAHRTVARLLIDRTAKRSRASVPPVG